MDDKVELIEAKHGITGFGVLVKLYQKIYKEGYFINVTEETLLILSKRINVDINKVNEVIKDCLKYDIFSDKLYKSFKILTSAGIQKRYLQAVDRRKDIELIKKYIIVDINGLNVNINWINDGNSTQSKVKESIVKESKEEEIKIIFPFDSENFKKLWGFWKDYKKQEHKFSYKTTLSEQAALKSIGEISGQNEEIAGKIIEQSIANGWQGFFELKNNNNGKGKSGLTEQDKAEWKRVYDKHTAGGAGGAVKSQ